MSWASTSGFSKRMDPVCTKLYHSLWPDCTVERVDRGSQLDTQFGIDAQMYWPDDGAGVPITIQEKTREWDVKPERGLQYCQELNNAVGTQYERRGEWWYLRAQLIFCGWATEDELWWTDWLFISVLSLRSVVRKAGGIKNMGDHTPNTRHSKSDFVAIPLWRIKSAVVKFSESVWPWFDPQHAKNWKA